jgi:hypothetical protein
LYMFFIQLFKVNNSQKYIFLAYIVLFLTKKWLYREIKNTIPVFQQE